MKAIYPIVISKADGAHPYLVYIPAFDSMTEGDSLSDAIYMARDAIGALGISYEDDGQPVPVAEDLAPAHEPDDIVTLVDIDFDEYRMAHDDKMVRRNVTLPSRLNYLAEKRHINVSGVLQQALAERLGIKS